MAEEYLRKLGGDLFETESAGLEPGELNPYVVELLREDGIDISGKQTNDVFDFFKQGRQYDYVITVCSKEAETQCPIFPGRVVRRNWGLDDPSSATGSDEQIAQETRRIRDLIVELIREFIDEYRQRHHIGG
jgi:arsenate reductase